MRKKRAWIFQLETVSDAAPEERLLSWEIQVHVPRDREQAAQRLGLFWHKGSMKEAA